MIRSCFKPDNKPTAYQRLAAGIIRSAIPSLENELTPPNLKYADRRTRNRETWRFNALCRDKAKDEAVVAQWCEGRPGVQKMIERLRAEYRECRRLKQPWDCVPRLDEDNSPNDDDL